MCVDRNITSVNMTFSETRGRPSILAYFCDLISVTRFGHLGKIYIDFGHFLSNYLIFGKIVNLRWKIFGQIFIVLNGQILKK